MMRYNKIFILCNLRLSIKFLIAITCLQVFGLVSVAQTKRALVIGLGKQEDNCWSKINGDKDVPIITEMLINLGFKTKNVITLVNEQATKNAIVSAFNDLTKSCKKSDIIYIHFSGHGQRVTDVDGDEKDGWDESWIPYDAYRDNCIMDKGEKHLIDDEIYLFLREIKGRIGNNGKILVVADACHSGGSSFGFGKFSYNKNISVFNKGITMRGISIPFIITQKSVFKTTKNPGQWLMLSACKSYEVNQEMNNPHVGILSYALYMISKKGNISMWKIEDFVKQNKGPYPQTPELTGNVNYSISEVLK